jgi:hypothetical protein
MISGGVKPQERGEKKGRRAFVWVIAPTLFEFVVKKDSEFAPQRR